MENSQTSFRIDPEKLTTSERRVFLDRMQKYFEYFQKMQKKAENHNIIDRVADAIKGENTKKQKEQEITRLKRYFKLVSQVYDKTKVEICNNSAEYSGKETVVSSLSGAAETNAMPAYLRRGLLPVGGGAMAAGSVLLSGSLLGAGLEIFDVVTGMSDKEQAIFYKKMCETLMEVVSAFNVPEEIVKQELLKTMKSIGEIKEKYKDISDEEEMAKRIQDECVVELTAGIEGRSDCEVFKTKALDLIGKAAWDKMNSNSQIFIVTGELLYEQWKIYDEGIDFAPICLSVSKALEVEVTRRYFIGFKEYLENAGIPLLDEMYKNNGTIKEAEDYMLGNLTSVTGYAVYLDTQKVKLVGRYTDANQLFLKYAKNELFKEKTESKCSEIIKEHLLNIKIVCEKYRNPAAHKQKMNKVSARECLDFMIDVKRVLGKILDDCEW